MCRTDDRTNGTVAQLLPFPVELDADVEGGRQAVVSDFDPTADLGAWVSNAHPVLMLRNADQANIRFQESHVWCGSEPPTRTTNRIVWSHSWRG